MSYSLRFAPELEEDLYSGFVWYDDKAKGLGDEFLTVFYSNVDQLAKTPLIYAKVYLDFHRSLLRQFPFACYYRVEGGMVIVYGLFHSARNPAFITTSLNTRDGVIDL